MGTKPQVTVGLPVYNAAASLAETLASVRAQTFEAWELVIVCNGCTDDSVDIARAAAQGDARVRVEVLERANLVAASNRVLELARAPLHARIDADDLMSPRRLALQVAALEAHPEWAVCTGHVVHDGAAGGMERYVAWLNSLSAPDGIRAGRFIDSPIAHPSATARTQLLRDVGGYRDGPLPEDYDLWLRVLGRGELVGRVAETVLIWRDLPTRLSRTDDRYSDDAMRRTKHEYLLSGPLRLGARPCRIWGSGKYGKRHARGLVAMGGNVEALIDINPRKIGGRAAGGIPVVGPDSLGSPDGTLTLIAVATRGARAEIQARLEKLGHVAERDFLAVQ